MMPGRLVMFMVSLVFEDVDCAGREGEGVGDGDGVAGKDVVTSGAYGKDFGCVGHRDGAWLVGAVHHYHYLFVAQTTFVYIDAFLRNEVFECAFGYHFVALAPVEDF